MGQGDPKNSWQRTLAGLLFVGLAIGALEGALYYVQPVGPIWAVRLGTGAVALGYGALIGGAGVLPLGVLIVGLVQAMQQPAIREKLSEVDWTAMAVFADSFIRDIYLVIFLGLSLYSYRQWRRTRHAASLWLVAGFMALTVISFLGILRIVISPDPPWMLRTSLTLLTVFPAAIYNFTRGFKRASPWPGRLVLVLAAGLSAYALYAPRLPSSEPGRDAGVFLVVLAIYWVGVSMASAIDLWRSGRSQRHAAKVRMRILGVGAAMLSLALIMAVATQRTPFYLLAAQVLALAGALCFYFGYSTPAWLRRLLQHEGRAYTDASEVFIKATHRGEIFKSFVELAAETVSASRVTLFTKNGDVVASAGEVSTDKERTIEQDYPFGRLVIEMSVYAPFFSQVEIVRLDSLAAMMNLALERVESERKYRIIFENFSVGIYQSSAEGKLLVANPKLAEICGYDSPEEMVEDQGLLQQVYVQEGRRDEFAELMMREGAVKDFESEIRRKDGSKIWIAETAQVVNDHNGTFLFFEGTVQDISERKAAQEELRRETEFTEGLIKSSINGVLAFDRDYRYTVWNPAMEKITGKKAEEVLGKVSYEVFPFLKEQGIIDNQYRIALSGNITPPVKIFYDVPETGRKGVAEAHYIPVRDTGGGVIGGMSIARDITEELEAERELQQRNAYLSTLHEVTLDLMGPLDTEQLITTIVEKAGQLLGSPDAYVYMLDGDGQTMTVRVGLGVFRDYIGFKLGKGEGMAGKVWQSDKVMIVNDYDSWPERSQAFPRGVFHAVAGAPLRQAGQVVGVIGLAHLNPKKSFSRRQVDLLAQFAELASLRLDRVRLHEEATAELGRRRKMEQALRESEEKFRSLAATATDGIVTFNEEGQIVYINPAGERMFGYGKEVVGRRLDVLFPTAYFNPDGQGINRFIPSEESKLMTAAAELSGCNAERGEFPIEVTLAKWKSGEGEEQRSYYTLIVRDISDRKRIDQAKRDFVSLVSHQLKTPVALIRGYIDNLLSGVLGEMPERQRRYLKDIQEISAKNYNLITDLLNASRLERGVISFVPKPAALADVVRQAVRPHEQRVSDKGLELILEGDESIRVELDIFKTAEAIGNVVDNALKFTDEGRIKVHWGTRQGGAFVEVEDTGAGMDEETTRRLFRRDEPFSSELVPNPGAGLGLYIAREFIVRQGGEILVESKAGQGSKFTFRLPLAKVKTKGGK